MIAGLALAFAGTLLIISKGRVEAITGLHLNLGNLWSLLAAIAFAWFSIRVRDWMRIIPPLPLTVITGWSGMLLVMLPVYLVWILYGGPWLAWHDADIPLALAAIGYIGLDSHDAWKPVLSLWRRHQRSGAGRDFSLS